MSNSLREILVWPDIDAVFRESMERNQWPEWLASASAYTTGLSLDVVAGVSKKEVRNWLEALLGRAFVSDSESEWLVDLKYGRRIPVEVEYVPHLVKSQLRFLFDQSATIRRPEVVDLGLPGIGDPEVFAFHSFKGGVGRTTTAIAFAHEVVKQHAGKVLLVDADLEAPGVSFLIEERVPDFPVSFSDLLALANDGHDYARACQIVADRVKSFSIDDLYFLPAYRSGGGLDEVGIRPEHLIKNARDPFVLSRLFSHLGRVLGVDAVVVDLRAGVSEIAAGLALDPSVKRVFVSTLSGQSFTGTKRLLDRIGRWDRLLTALSASDLGFEPPHVVLSQVSEDMLPQAEDLYVSEIISAYMGIQNSVDCDRGSLGVSLIVSIVPHHGDLLSLPGTWDRAVHLIRRAEIGSSLGALVSRVARHGEIVVDTDPVTAASSQIQRQDREEQRHEIEKFADSLEFAESGTGQGFLVTDAIRNMVVDFRGSLPSMPVVGKKGAGKSYMFLQVVRSRTWSKFCLSAGVGGNPPLDAEVFPVLAPLNLEGKAEALVDNARLEFAKAVGANSLPLADCRDRIREAFRYGEDELAWRGFWVELFCKSVGFSAFEELLSHLRLTDRRLIFVLDGLEDIFQTLHESRVQQAALRSLLVETIGWLNRNGEGRLGIICFVRHDMAVSSVKQNFGQFFQKYKRYALHWGRVDALRLAAWVADQSGALGISIPDEVDEPAMSQMLIPLWGQKLGSPNANEAHTSEWVLAALSDFRGQVQARDVVRFLKISAQLSKDGSAWLDRVLIPKAIRGAPEICGERKIADVEQESPELKVIFGKLREASDEKRVIPFNPAEFDLAVSDLALLEREGVVLRESDGYYMPETYRQGLRFSLPRGARPRVLALARRARAGLAPFL